MKKKGKGTFWKLFSVELLASFLSFFLSSFLPSLSSPFCDGSQAPRWDGFDTRGACFYLVVPEVPTGVLLLREKSENRTIIIHKIALAFSGSCWRSPGEGAATVYTGGAGRGHQWTGKEGASFFDLSAFFSSCQHLLFFAAQGLLTFLKIGTSVAYQEVRQEEVLKSVLLFWFLFLFWMNCERWIGNLLLGVQTAGIGAWGPLGIPAD